jgi:dipeptidyl aminopeptidase/acylaminoacyl peptidase
MWKKTNSGAQHEALRASVNLFVIAATCFALILTDSGSLVLAAAPAAQAKIALVGVHATGLLATPGGQAVTTLAPAATVTASGRSADSQWAYVITDDGQSGWVAAGDLVLFGVASLPVLSVDTEPAIEPAVSAGNESSVRAVPDPNATAEESVAPDAASQGLPATQDFVVEVATTDARLNIRSGPGVQYAVVGKAQSGQQLIVLARNEQGDWFQVAQPGAGEGASPGVGWVSAEFVRGAALLQDLPIAPAPAEPANRQGTVMANPLLVSGSASLTQSEVAQVAGNEPVSGLQGKIVFSTGRGGMIYLYNLETGELRPLTSGNDPSLSPDGTRVAFTRTGGENSIYVINSDGSGEQKIFGERQLLSSPKWSPDGQWIVFSSSNGTWECYQLGPSCQTRTQLENRNPALADPEVAEQFFKDLDLVENYIWTLARVNASGGEYRDIAAMDTARTPDWNEIGIVYQSTGGLQKTADTPEAENQAVVAEHYVHDPDWQPGGGRIVYQERRGSHWEIFAVNPDGSGKAALTRPATVLVDQLPSNVSPAWSPDGRHIVFLSNRTDDDEAGDWRIWVMDGNGENQRPLDLAVSIDYTYTGEQMVDWGF